MARPAPITPEQREAHHRWLLDVTGLPTAAGREQRVAAWIDRWAAERPDLALRRDAHGNLDLSFQPRKGRAPAGPPVYFTAHMDHPAFVVERIVSPTTLEVSFRGGVMDDYFAEAEVRWHGDHAAVGGTLREALRENEPFKRYLAEFDHALDARPGDIVTWDLPSPQITPEIPGGMLHTPVCDDLAALAAALGAYDVLRERRAGGGEVGDVRLLFTRAEEIGFVGAIGACREKTMPTESRVIALENSRASGEAPIGGGPIVRVGDRLSVFSPVLTDAINRRAEQIAGGSQPTASQKLADAPAWKWQRKLMSGGACEASVFCAYGYEATCLCLPLGNYHNMADLDAVQAGSNTCQPRVAREYISVSDFDGLVDLLVACGESLPAPGGFGQRMEKLWNERRFVLQ